MNVCEHRAGRRSVSAGLASTIRAAGRNRLLPGSQRLPGGLSRFSICCCRQRSRVARLQWWTRVRRRSQGCAKRTSKRLDLYGVRVSTLDSGLAISRTLVVPFVFEFEASVGEVFFVFSGEVCTVAW